MPERLTRIFVLAFGLAGVGFLAGAFLCARSELQFRARATSAPGTIVDLARTPGSSGAVYRPVFEFIGSDGRGHRVPATVASNPPAYRMGESVTVRFPPENPEAAQLVGFAESWFGTVVLGGLGAVFASLAGGFAAAEVRRRARRAWLAAHGTRVRARRVGVERDTSLRAGGKNPWRICAQWQNPADGKVYAFRSDPIWFDPSPYLRGDTVEARVDPADPRRHEVDTGFLPEAGRSSRG